MRVLQVLTCDGLGGTEHMISTMLERIDRSTVHSSVVTLDRPGPIAERLARSGIGVRAFGGHGLLLAFARLAGILRNERFDIVNAYGFKATVVVRMLVRLLARGTCFVSGVRGLHVSELERLDGAKSRFVLAVERLASPLVDVYDANSRGAVDLLSSSGIDPTRLRYIPNGIDLDRWSSSSRRDRKCRAEPVVLSVARFVPRKRHRDLIEAAAQLQRQGVAFRLVLAGAGPTLDAARKHAAALGLAREVNFLGSVGTEHVRELLSETDIFCLASLWEGMSGSVMEAMASGLPVVGTKVSGIAELVDEGSTGLLVPPERPDLLAAALAQLLKSPGEAAKMGRAGRARIEKHFSLERMVSAKQNLYLELAGRS